MTAGTLPEAAAGRPPRKVAWISFFPVEWLPHLPELLRGVPRQHPATWQRVLLEEIRGTPGLELHVFSIRKHYPRHCSFQQGGVNFHCLRVPAGMRTVSLFWWETLLLSGRLRRLRPDLVHAWGSERGAALVGSRLGYPWLVTMQGLLEWYAQRVDLGRVGKIEACLERVSLRRARLATTESTFSAGWLAEHYPHLEIRQAEHAPAWLFHRVRREPVTRPVQFLFVGFLTRIKGADLLLRALDRLRPELDFRLTIVGSAAPDFMADLRAATSAALWERISLRENLSPAEVAAEMARATMTLFPTRADTSPNSIKEAVVAGLPVVASGLGGILDYVVPGRNGVHFPPGDIEAFIAAVRSAVAHPLLGRGQVEPETLARLREYLSPKLMGERFLSAYDRALELGRMPAPAS